MAIVQISKIQHRYGNLIDLPTLDNAELGYAIDEKRLFIGTAQTGPDENVEVLTSYSQISFSQIDGSGANLNVDTANLVNGQILGYDGSDWVNKGGDVGGLITLGNVGDVKINGGSAGFVLETDGTGNLSWSPKNVIIAYISNVTKASPAVVTTSEDNFFVTGSLVQITDVEGMTELNGNSYYAKVVTSTTFQLYTDSSLSVPLNSTAYNTYTGNGRVLSSFGGGGGGGTGAAGGANTQVQFNYNGIVYGVPNFTYNFNSSLMTLNGNASISGNINVSNIVASSNVYVSGNLSVTGNGTVQTLTATALTGTAPLTVSSNTKVTNLNADLLDGFDSSSTATANTIALRDNLGNLYAAWFVGSGSSLTSINAANIFGQVPNSIVAGTVYACNQPNITSTGTLASLSVSGTISSGGNIRAPWFIGNVQGNISGNFAVNGSDTNVLFNDNGNANATSGFTFNKTSNAVVVSGTLTAANLSTSGTVTAANVVTGTLTTTGNASINYLSVNGDIDSGGSVEAVNILGIIRPTAGSGTAGIIFPADPGGGSGDLATIKYYAATGEQTVLELNVTNDADDRIYINATGGTTIFNTLTTTSISSGSVSTAGTITGQWTLVSGSTLQATYADLAEYYEADQVYEPGTVLEFGGEKEVTLASDGTTRVAGVVSTSPAYVMNAQCEGIALPIALQGRVPVKVRGKIRKGDMMVSAGEGYARPWNNPQLGTVIGKSLENFEGLEGIIEIAIGRL